MLIRVKLKKDFSTNQPTNLATLKIIIIIYIPMTPCLSLVGELNYYHVSSKLCHKTDNFYYMM